MTLLRSHSILSASMDNIDESINDSCKLLSISSPEENNLPGPDAAATQRYSIPTRESLKIDHAIEEEGCRQIIEALTPQERRDMSDPNLPLRHFRADKGNIDKAITRAKYAIKWRKEMKVEEMLKAAHNPSTPEESEIRTMLMKEAETGKIYVRGYDREGRAVMYLYGNRENTHNDETNIKHLVYAIERMIACSKRKNFEKSVLVFDFLGWKLKHACSMALLKMTIHIVQDCYVERIERIYFANAPSIFNTFFNMAKVFLDPHTKDKILFVKPRHKDKLERFFDFETCEKCIFGSKDLKEYNVEDYFSVPLNATFDEDP